MPDQKQINVLFVTHYRELYGANNSLLQLILELKEKGINPIVLLPDYEIKPDNDLGIVLDTLDIRHLDAKIRFDKHTDWKKSAVSYLRTLSYRKAVANVVRGLDFQLVHSNSSTISVGAYIAKKFGKPHIWHIREFGDLDYGMKTPFCKSFQKIIYQGHNSFIAISEAIRKHYAPWIGSQDIRVIYNGIKPSPKRIPMQKEIVDICIVGHIQKEKGQMEIIEALNELVHTRNVQNLHLTMVGGSDSQYLDKINEYIEKNGLSGFVTMTGRRNDVPELLTKMDIGIMTSFHEAFGRTTVEYMMAGLAVIASDGGANKEIIEDGITGLIYKSGNPTALADKIEFLINKPEQRELIAQRGQNSAEQKFSSKANSDAIFDLYKEVLKIK